MHTDLAMICFNVIGHKARIRPAPVGKQMMQVPVEVRPWELSCPVAGRVRLNPTVAESLRPQDAPILYIVPVQ